MSSQQCNATPPTSSRYTVDPFRNASPYLAIYSSANGYVLNSETQPRCEVELLNQRNGVVLTLLLSDGTEYSQSELITAMFQIETIVKDSNGDITSLRNLALGHHQHNWYSIWPTHHCGDGGQKRIVWFNNVGLSVMLFNL